MMKIDEVWWSKILKGEPSIDVQGIEDALQQLVLHVAFGWCKSGALLGSYSQGSPAFILGLNIPSRGVLAIMFGCTWVELSD